MKTMLTTLCTLLLADATYLVARPPQSVGQEALVPTGKGQAESPYFEVHAAQPGVDALPLKSTSVKASVAGVIAAVTVTQVYKNEGTTPLEAVYVFPGGTRAAVHGMTMTIGDRVIRASIKEKDAARRDYGAAKAEGRSASLLEQERPNVFCMQVANILPGDEIRVDLAYSELLTPKEGLYTFVFPTVVGPRYKRGQDAPKSISTYRDKAVPCPFDISLDLQAGIPIASLESRSHAILQYPRGRDGMAVTLAGPDQADRDFILTYRLAGDALQQGLLLFQGEKENFFLMMMQPPRRVELSQVPPREFLFLVDVSGSMYGYPMETAKEIMNGLIGGLRPQDSFNLVTFAAGQRVWSGSGSQPANAGNRLKAMEFMAAQEGRGGSELVAALETTFALPRKESASRTVVLISDGYVDVEAKALDVVRENLAGTNVFAFGIGTAVNRFLMEGLAHIGQGEAFVVTNPAEAAGAAAKFRRYVECPVLSQIHISFGDFEAYDIEPIKVPDVLAERPVLTFGKWKGKPKGTIEVSGQTAMGPYHHFIHVQDVEPSEKNRALEPLWARHRVQSLADYALLGGAANKAEITRLGLAYNLVTDYTSFLAVDSEIRNPGTLAVPVIQPLPVPTGRDMAGIAFLAPGVTRSGSYGGSTATVEVTASTFACAAAEHLEGGVTVQSEGQNRNLSKGAVPSVKVGPVTSNRSEVPLTWLTGLLEQKVKSLIRAGHMGSLPATFTLDLQIDAAGAVVLVELQEALGASGKRLESAIRGWRFAPWPVTGLTQIRVPIQVSR